MKAILWNYRFADMQASWKEQMLWLVKALQHNGVEVKQHPKFICRGLSIPKYDFNIDRDADICIYNHTDVSQLIGNILPTNANWFFKPTVPDNLHVTLDNMGYGAFSSITYYKPNYENINYKLVKSFFNTKVDKWIEQKCTKFGYKFPNADIKVEEEDYYLIVGQCVGDETVKRFDFGDYLSKLTAIATELIRIDNRKVIIKLHPYTDGHVGGAINPANTYSNNIKLNLEKISDRVKVVNGNYNIHSYIKNSRCVLMANSSAGFETMMHGKPIITWGCPEYRWTSYDLRHLADLINAIKLDWFDKEKQDKFLYWYMEEYCFYNQETANQRVKELLFNKY